MAQQTLSHTETTDHTADQEAIRAVVAGLEAAWNNGDAEAWSATSAADVVHTVWNGHVAEGRDAVIAGHEHIFRTVYKDTRLTLTVRWIRFLRPDVAAVQMDGALEGADNAPRVRPLAVLSKEEGRWQLRIFQNTPILARPGGDSSSS